MKYSDDADAKDVTTDVVFLSVSLKTKDVALLPNNDVVSLSIGKIVATVVSTVKLASNFKTNGINVIIWMISLCFLATYRSTIKCIPSIIASRPRQIICK